MEFYWLSIGILAVWRITHLLSAEDGPWDVVYHLRVAAGRGIAGRLLDCFSCASIWVAMPLAFWIGDGWIERLVLLPALSGGAIVLERVTAAREKKESASFVEDKEDNNVMLREETGTATGDITIDGKR
jgi:hypothetical protein